MSPRNPEEISDVDLRNEALQDTHGTTGHNPQAAPDFKVFGPLAPVPRPGDKADTQASPDRVEAYLKGPTVFSA
ncbi:hypothetical protein [Microvirga sp. TS319]|uniref:hypothetical protein n=1 Tax=Microvirga sp. TS319 TaxID=3241165 RepID=UPI00351A0765